MINFDVTSKTGVFNITKNSRSLTAVDKTKVYGSDDPQLTTTDSGFLAADLGTGKIVFSASRAAGESVTGGLYTITPDAKDGATSLLGNYDVTYKTGQLTVTKKGLTGIFTSADKVYDGTDAAAATDRALVGAVKDDKVSLSGGTATFESRNVGDRTATLAGAELAGDDKGNYTLESVA